MIARLIFAALLTIVLLGNVTMQQSSGSVSSTQATALPGVHASPLPSPLATPTPRSDEQRERRAARREAKRAGAAQAGAANWAEPRP